ncbi:M1 family metallopeptidase [Fodinibacter luteus]|uniref:Aminopeptidase N n=1 Tax=Fodinibacter luteus TaxID=552064 RepID=A0ABP8KS42_9MICO
MTGSDPYLPGHGDDRYEVEHYALDLRYKPLGNHLEGRAELSVRAVVDLPDLVVDLHRLEVRSLKVEGARVARWSHRGSRLRIRLATPVRAGEPLLLTIAYRGNPRPMPGPDGPAGWEELTDGVLVAAQPHGAPTWFPCNDRMADKARYRIRVETDPAYRLVANGDPVTERTVGRRTEWVFEQRQPMSPYLATLQLGRYAAERQPASPVATWLVAPPARMPAARQAFADQPRMVELFSGLFGPYPFDRYTAVVTDDPLEIPLESQSLSTFGTNHLSRDWEVQRLVAHELSHQWFGNAVTAASLSDIWLHEGFACYSEWLWSQASGRTTADEEAAHHHALLARSAQDLVLTDPGPHRVFDDRVYKRGALTLHALRRRVGDEAFFAVLRTWVDTHRYEVVTTADFEATVAAVTGSEHTDLFDAWLRAARLPTLPPLPTRSARAVTGVGQVLSRARTTAPRRPRA